MGENSEGEKPQGRQRSETVTAGSYEDEARKDMRKVEAGWGAGGAAQNRLGQPRHAEGAKNLKGGTGSISWSKDPKRPVAPTEVSEEAFKSGEGQPPVKGAGRRWREDPRGGRNAIGGAANQMSRYCRRHVSSRDR